MVHTIRKSQKSNIEKQVSKRSGIFTIVSCIDKIHSERSMGETVNKQISEHAASNGGERTVAKD